MPVTRGFELKPGSNVMVAVRDASTMPDEPLAELAGVLAAALGTRAGFAGESGDSQVWVMGPARPVYLRVQPPGPTIDQWYRDQGRPVGPTPLYASIAIDWRDTRTVQLASVLGAWVVPGTVIRGAATWPDGDAEQQATRLRTQELDAELARFGVITAATDDAIKAVAVAAETTARAAGGIGLGLGIIAGLYALSKLRRR